jgi:uncharacterized protein (UPF0332 family)
VHGAFAKHFIASGLMDARFHRWLLDAFDQRVLGDYGPDVVVTQEGAARMLDQAREFVAAARRLLEGAA